MNTNTITVKVSNRRDRTIKVNETDMTITCDVCGDDLYVHEWIELDRMHNYVLDCDRAS